MRPDISKATVSRKWATELLSQPCAKGKCLSISNITNYSPFFFLDTSKRYNKVLFRPMPEPK
jgi:hypothetical protein